MKLATTTTAPIDFDAMQAFVGAHDAGYKAKQLARRRAHYAALFQRYQDLLTLDDEGFEVSITLRSATKTVVLSAKESERAFDLSELYDQHGKHMGALQDEIIDLLREKDDDDTGLWAGTDLLIMHQIVALCMPQPADHNSVDFATATTLTAKAA